MNGSGVLALSSQPGSRTGYGVNKRFSLDAARGVATIEYELVNHVATSPAAPWEISRGPREGLVFFPSESAPTAESTLASESRSNVAWVDIARAPADDSKLFQDGSEGWLAYVQGDVAFIKTFENVPASEQAPGEAEIEIFVSGGFGYVEIEQQGRYAAIPAGASSTWSVRWLLRKLPAGVDATLGNMALVDWVRGEIATAAR